MRFSLFPALLFAAAATAAAPPQPTAAPGPAAQPTPLGPPPIEHLLEETARLRGHAFTGKVQWEVLPADELRAKFTDTQLVADDIALTEKMLKKFGLIPPELDLLPTLTALLGEQVAGFYDPKVKKLYALDGTGHAMLDAMGPAAGAIEVNHTLVHELTHALQDQQFDLATFIDEDALATGELLDDEVTARLALAEGDAMMVGLDFTLQSLIPGQPMTALDLPPGMLAGLLQATAEANIPGTEELAAAPPYVRQSLFFPYTAGFEFAGQLRRTDGWAGVDAAYTRIPESTEQILHIEKYRTPDHPTRVPAVDLATILPDAWVGERPANLGELDVRLLLQEYVERDRAIAASAGWDGDRVFMFSRADTGAVFIVWASVWDAPAEAEEFTAAYGDALTARYGPTTAAGRWQTADGEVSLERRGAWVVTVDALPAADRARVAARVWAALKDIQPTP